LTFKYRKHPGLHKRRFAYAGIADQQNESGGLGGKGRKHGTDDLVLDLRFHIGSLIGVTPVALFTLPADPDSAARSGAVLVHLLTP
jgi:hypothetical protein